MTWVILEIILTGLQIFAQWLFFRGLGEKKYSHNVIPVLSLIILMAIPWGCEAVHMMPTVKLVLYMLSSFFVFYMLFQIPAIKLFLAEFYIMVAVILGETAATAVLMLLYDYKNVQVFLERGSVRVETLALSIVVYVFLLFMGRKWFKTDREKEERKSLFFLIQTFSVMVIIILLIELSVSSINLPKHVVVFMALAVGFAVVSELVFWWMLDQHYLMQKEMNQNLMIQEYARHKTEYLDMKAEANLKIRQIYHDLKYHVQAMNKMEQAKELEEYLQNINASVNEYEDFCDSGNQILDMLMYDKIIDARNKKVMCRMKVEDKCLQGFPTYELVSLYLNALDNAIEACNKLDENQRSINVEIYQQGEYIESWIRNSCKEEIRKDGNGGWISSKGDRNKHGIGHRSMQTMLQKLGGEMLMECKDGVATLYFKFIVPSSEAA